MQINEIYDEMKGMRNREAMREMREDRMVAMMAKMQGSFFIQLVKASYSHP